VSLYSGLAATATRLITAFGQACTLSRTIVNGTAATTQTGVAVEVEINEGDRRQLGGPAGVAPIGTHKYLLGPSVTPRMGERITVGSDTSIIRVVDAIKPGATVLAWSVLAVAG
jgi:hypothetical protein